MAGASGLSLGEMARLLGGRVVGNASRVISRIAPLDEAGPADLSLLAQPRYRREAKQSLAGALLVREGLTMAGRDQIVVEDPHFALSVLLPRLHPETVSASGISRDARIAEGASIGDGVTIGPFAVIEAGCRIGARARLGAGCFVGSGSEVGEDSILHPNTTIYQGCRLGSRVIVHAGSVIGSDGFGYATRGGVHHKVPQIGGVVIEDDVEIGSCVAIDRGSVGTTLVGRGTKIDNLVQIAHNVRIGPGCLIVAQVGISGSTRIGAGTVFAGQSGAAGHLAIGAGAAVASKSAVYDDLPTGARVAGIPAIDHRLWKRAQALFRRLPELAARVRALELREKLGGPGRRSRKAVKGGKKAR